jgi:NADH-quinone oxidoreductase subunit C
MTDSVLQALKSRFPDSILSSGEFRGDLTLQVRRQDIVRVCSFLRDDPAMAFDMLIDLCGVDMYRPQGRFEVVYHLYSLGNKRYLRLKVAVDEEECVVDTVSSVWAAADWHERETFDMFGIQFAGHPDLRRMYMPEEFEYHPLRKDFPLMGIPDSLSLPRTVQ